MTAERAQHNPWAMAGAGLGVGLVVGFLAARTEPAEPNPQARALDADLWVQTSGEYRACCLQTYRLAWERLQQRLKASAPGPKPRAVIMDLDETVMDNSPFQTWLYRYRLAYSDELWEAWERDHPDEVLLVPGAKGFIDRAEQAGVTVVYISNRLEKYRAATVRALEHLGLSTRDLDKDRLLLASGTSDKTKRRERARSRYDVLMLVGDNLRDFDDVFRAGKADPDDPAGLRQQIEARLRKVDERAGKWGEEWIVLPNPVYGEWQKLQGRRPVEVMRPTRMAAP